MSQENVQIVRSICAAWGRGDFNSNDWADERIEVVVGDGPEQGTWQGRDRMEAGWRGFLRAWGDYRVEVEEFREPDTERVLTLMRHGGYGRASGLGDARSSRQRGRTCSTCGEARW